MSRLSSPTGSLYDQQRGTSVLNNLSYGFNQGQQSSRLSRPQPAATQPAPSPPAQSPMAAAPYSRSNPDPRTLMFQQQAAEASRNAGGSGADPANLPNFGPPPPRSAANQAIWDQRRSEAQQQNKVRHDRLKQLYAIGQPPLGMPDQQILSDYYKGASYDDLGYAPPPPDSVITPSMRSHFQQRQARNQEMLDLYRPAFMREPQSANEAAMKERREAVRASHQNQPINPNAYAKTPQGQSNRRRAEFHAAMSQPQSPATDI